MERNRFNTADDEANENQDTLENSIDDVDAQPVKKSKGKVGLIILIVIALLLLVGVAVFFIKRYTDNPFQVMSRASKLVNMEKPFTFDGDIAIRNNNGIETGKIKAFSKDGVVIIYLIEDMKDNVCFVFQRKGDMLYFATDVTESEEVEWDIEQAYKINLADLKKEIASGKANLSAKDVIFQVLDSLNEYTLSFGIDINQLIDKEVLADTLIKNISSIYCDESVKNLWNCRTKIDGYEMSANLGDVFDVIVKGLDKSIKEVAFVGTYNAVIEQVSTALEAFDIKINIENLFDYVTDVDLDVIHKKETVLTIDADFSLVEESEIAIKLDYGDVLFTLKSTISGKTDDIIIPKEMQERLDNAWDLTYDDLTDLVGNGSDDNTGDLSDIPNEITSVAINEYIANYEAALGELQEGSYVYVCSNDGLKEAVFESKGGYELTQLPNSDIEAVFEEISDYTKTWWEILYGSADIDGEEWLYSIYVLDSRFTKAFVDAGGAHLALIREGREVSENTIYCYDDGEFAVAFCYEEDSLNVFPPKLVDEAIKSRKKLKTADIDGVPETVKVYLAD